MKQIADGVYIIEKKLATLNNSPGFRVYDEKLVKKNGKEYRMWNPHRSKLAAALKKGLNKSPFQENSDVLYLGASSGTTASHVADICREGAVYCVEFSKRMMRDLIPVTEKKVNMIPICADANQPVRYKRLIPNVDIIYQDVAQPNQAEILKKNRRVFGPKYALLAIKSRSIDTIKDPKKVFEKELSKLKKDFKALEVVDLQPFEKDHVLVNLQAK